MKFTRQCPKCGSRDIVRCNGTSGPHGAGNNIQVGFSIFSAVMVNRYICCYCGFSEEWIDEKDLPRLKASSKTIPL